MTEDRALPSDDEARPVAPQTAGASRAGSSAQPAAARARTYDARIAESPIPAPLGATGVGPSVTQRPARRGSGALARATTVVTAAVLLSRFLGFLRDASLSDRFGAGQSADVYVIAGTIPLIIFGIIGQALPTVFIPQYTRVLRSEGQERATALANNINTTLTTIALILMGLMWLLAPTIVDIVAPGVRRQNPAEAVLAASLVRIMVPIVLFYIWAAIMQGILNVHGHFLAPAAMGVPQNLAIIAAIFAGALSPLGIKLVAWGATIGTAFAFLIQLPPLRRTNFRFRIHIDLHDPFLRRTVVLAGPVIVASTASQLGVTVDRMLASRLSTGGISAIYYATRLQQFAYAVVGLAISTVIFPQLAGHAGGESLDRFKYVATRGLRMLSLIALPVTVGAVAFHYGVVRLIFGHGAFTAADAARAAGALLGFSPGILTYAFMDYLMRIFFARQNTRVPMIAAIVSVSINIAGDFLLVGRFREFGLCLASSLAWGGASLVLIYWLRRDLGHIDGRQTVGTLLRMFAASLVGVVPAYALYSVWIGRFAGQRFLLDAVGLIGATVVATGLYLLTLARLKVPELDDALRLVVDGFRRLGFGV